MISLLWSTVSWNRLKLLLGILTLPIVCFVRGPLQDQMYLPYVENSWFSWSCISFLKVSSVLKVFQVYAQNFPFSHWCSSFWLGPHYSFNFLETIQFSVMLDTHFYLLQKNTVVGDVCSSFFYNFSLNPFTRVIAKGLNFHNLFAL